MIRFRKIWLWAFLFGFVLFLLSSNSTQRSAWNPAEQWIIEVTAPIQKVIKQSDASTEDFWLNYFDLVDVRNVNRQLRSALDVLEMENNRYRELLATQGRLQELLQFKETMNRPVLAARVTGRDPAGWFQSIIIDKGTGVGLRLNMAVVNACGVVGRVVSLSKNYAKVLLIIDQNSAVDCLVQRSRDRGIVKGLSIEICKFDYVARTSDVVVGDMVVTSGLGGIFPKGLPVGRILTVEEVSGELFKKIEIKPAVDFSKLEEVLVTLEQDQL